jgi:SAM-dependent methyltransferase
MGQESVRPFRTTFELFLISLIILFLELACIRWFPAHVLYLTFFTNTVLLASFLGMSVGCLSAKRPKNYIAWTPMLLALAMFCAHGVEYVMNLQPEAAVQVGSQGSPQMVFFGTEEHGQDVAQFVIPIEVLGGFFFLVIAMAMMGPGQELGRALNRIPNRVQAYAVNILGSIVGIVLFSMSSWAQLTPFWWFLPIVLGLGYFALQRPQLNDLVIRGGLLGLVLVAAAWHSGALGAKYGNETEQLWSPYYRIDYAPPPRREIGVNLIAHQQMVSRDDSLSPGFAYDLPYLLNRDARREIGKQPASFEEVLVIGAGSGNDISRALKWGAGHVDAVEIDPTIQRLGQEVHPDHPYQDERVTVHLDDGRNFLRSSDRKYDLIIYALVDSLVLHSSYSNIRLESFLFTRQALADVRAHLKPGGLFLMYNFFRQGWIVARLHKGLEEVFEAPPLALTLPFEKTIDPDQSFKGFTLLLAGDGTQPISEAFQRQPYYWLSTKTTSILDSGNGFDQTTIGEELQRQAPSDPAKEKPAWLRFGLAHVVQPPGLNIATDDWPFLYLREPMIPALSLRGMAVMGTLALLLLLLFSPRRAKGERPQTLYPRMFFLGAGFMLIETKAVVNMALLFGSTWMVNSVVFLAVLVMMLAANLLVLQFRPKRIWPHYVGLLMTLALNGLIPLDFFLGLDRWLQVIGSCFLVFTPVLFAGVIFAVSFRECAEPDRALGANIAGAMVGGLAEYSSMLLGFQYLVLVALVFYALSAVLQFLSLAAVLPRK